jgi:lipopolysaccharide heptosyltransferase I
MSAPRVLITRLSALGDCVLTLPVLCALRQHWPDAFVAWVAEPGPASVLAGHGSLDELIVVPKGWLKSPRKLWNLRRRLRSLRFDIAVDPQSLTRSAMAAWLSGAPRRIGFAAPVGRELAPWLDNERRVAEHEHVVDRQLELLRPLGIEAPAVRFSIPENPAAEQTVSEFVAGNGLQAGFVALNPGATWDSRLWPVDRYAAVARFLGAELGLRSVAVWAGAREREWAREITAGAQGHTVFAPPTSVPELTSLLRRARLYVGSDTGPMHVAAAVGTPCVGLFGTTRPEQSGPYGPQHLTLQAYYQAGTSRERRRAPNDAMRAIEVPAVCTACARILTRSDDHRLPVQAA